MSMKQATLVKTLGLTLASVMALSACQDATLESATAPAPVVDAASEAPVEVAPAPAPAPALLGVVPSASLASNGRASSSVTSCNVELVNMKSMDGEVPSISKAADINIVGWFVDEKAASIGDPLVFKISNADQTQFWDVPVVNRTERQDIVAAFKNNANYSNAGFDVVLNLSQFPAGRYNVYLSHATTDTEQLCGQGRSIVIE